MTWISSPLSLVYSVSFIQTPPSCVYQLPPLLLRCGLAWSGLRRFFYSFFSRVFTVRPAAHVVSQVFCLVNLIPSLLFYHTSVIMSVGLAVIITRFIWGNNHLQNLLVNGHAQNRWSLVSTAIEQQVQPVCIVHPLLFNVSCVRFLFCSTNHRKSFTFSGALILQSATLIADRTHSICNILYASHKWTVPSYAISTSTVLLPRIVRWRHCKKAIRLKGPLGNTIGPRSETSYPLFHKDSLGFSKHSLLLLDYPQPFGERALKKRKKKKKKTYTNCI